MANLFFSQGYSAFVLFALVAAAAGQSGSYQEPI
jgi:hypothetical protein